MNHVRRIGLILLAIVATSILLLPLARGQTPSSQGVTVNPTTKVLTGPTNLFRANRSSVITDGLGTAAERGATKVVHIAIRTDGRDGIGTAEDPRDGSTAAKLDAIFPALPAGAVVELGEGTFETTGIVVDYQLNMTTTSGVVMKSGTVLRGRGPDRTTLKLKTNTIVTGTYNTTNTLQRRDLIASTSDATGAVVERLTVDANRDNQSAFTSSSVNTLVYAINLSGLDSAIRDVTVRGVWNLHASAELFPVTISSNQGTWDRPATGYIERVRFEEMSGYATALNLLGGYSTGSVTATGSTFTSNAHGLTANTPVVITAGSGGTGLTQLRVYFARDITTNTFGLAPTIGGAAITLGSGLSGGTWVSLRPMAGAIRDCVIVSRPSGGTYSTWQGIGAGGWKDVVVERNVIDGVFGGVFIDTPPIVGATIRHNTIYARANPSGFGAFGIFVGGGYLYQGLNITDNDVRISSNAQGIRLNGNSRDVLIARNTVRDDFSTYGGTVAVGVSLRNAGNANIRAEANRFDNGNKTIATEFKPYLTSSGAADANIVTSIGNRYVSGAVATVARDDDVYNSGTAQLAQLSVSGGDGTVSQSSLWADQDFVYLNRVSGNPFINSEESIVDWNGGNVGGWVFHFNGSAMANKFLTTSDTGAVTPITLTAGQSVRMNAGGTALEAFSPAVVDGNNTYTGTSAFQGQQNFVISTGVTFEVYMSASSTRAIKVSGTTGGAPNIGFFGATPVAQQSGNVQDALAAYGLVSSATVFVAAPATSSSTGTAGQIAYDSSYFYICTATNTWRRIAHSTW